MSDDLERLFNFGAEDDEPSSATPRDAEATSSTPDATVSSDVAASVETTPVAGTDLERVAGVTPAPTPGSELDLVIGSAVQREPVEGGRVARRLAEKAELDAQKSSKRAPRVPNAPKELGEGSTAEARKPPKVSVVGVLGELLITAGVVVLMFLGWQIWINDKIVGNEQQHQAAEISQEWDKGEGTAPAEVDRPDPGPPPVAAAPGNAEVIANVIIPRLGADWVRTLRQGIGVHDVLNQGLGHYPDTQMPGEVGNFAIAGHRTGWGAPLENIVNLEVGDSIYIETEDGWYRYVYRSHEYVMPTGVEVLEAVPNIVGGTATDRILTITSCNPPLTAAERIVSYAVYDTWYPRAGGPPPEIAALVQAQAAAVG
ncbi:class E sortase [Schumannella luteola]